MHEICLFLFLHRYNNEVALSFDWATTKKLTNFILSCEITGKKLKDSEIKYQKVLENLDNSLFARYERTGKRPILTALQFKKNKKGN